MLKRILLGVLSISSSVVWANQSVNLMWNASPDPTVVGYSVYYGPAPGNYTNRLDAGAALTLTTPALADGTYYFSATARDANGNESDFANVISTNLSTPVIETALVTGETLGTARNNLNAGTYTTAWQGMKFLVGSQPMTVTALGRWCISGSSRTHAMKLVNATTQADVPNSSVTLSLAGATPGQFAYAKLPAPVTLSNNASYYLVCQDINGGDAWYNYDTTVATTSAAKVQSAIYSFDSVNWGAVGAVNSAYGPVDLKYFVGGSVSSTFSVCGTVALTDGTPVSGVILNLSNGGGTVTTDASGNYCMTVTNGWSGTITPVLGCYSFTSASRTYTNVNANQTAQNYTALPVFYAVRGTIRDSSNNSLSGATIRLSTGATTNSDANGNYSFTVPCGWSGMATLSLNNYAFSPASRGYANVSADQLAQDYVGTLLLVTNHYVLSQSLGTLRTNLNAGPNTWAWQGMKIIVLNQPITVTALGRWCIAGSSNTHTLKLVNAATCVDVPNSSVNISLAGAPAGRFIYGTLPTPVTLSSNTAYYLVNNDTNGAAPWYNYDTTVTTTSVAQGLGAVYSFNGTLYGVVGATNSTYGSMDFQYVTTNSSLASKIRTPITAEALANPVTVTLTLSPIADYCRILASSNLVDWAEVGETLVEPDGTVSFDMPLDPDVEMRFYRASP